MSQAPGVNKPTLATAWLDGCSGCHMSLLDLDERLLTLAAAVTIVYSPLVDVKRLPEQVDIGILEGAVSSADDLEKARQFRSHCRILVSLGDCAVNGNVPSMRNAFPLRRVLDRAFQENVDIQAQIPNRELPALFETVRPIHAMVDVDVFIPGCPPTADAIWAILQDLLAGRIPNTAQLTRFGA